MISTHHQRRQRDVLTTNSYATFYGAMVMCLMALINGDALAPALNLQWLGAMSYLAIFGFVLGISGTVTQ